MNTKRVYLGLGTNTGNKNENLARAIELLSLALGSPVALSGIIESEPWGFESENRFLNCVAAFDTTLSPTLLLDTTEEIERTLGRTRKSLNGQYSDRIIDIDILFYGNEIIENERLNIPHPLLHKRDFVLLPLQEIAPQLVHPRLHKSIEELAKELNHNALT
ncbi:MAG: 2-amino-4-hydroxy-6-hydroxymethyldihydropteridine diphosphokinase [Bacteroidales bacterium]|nr:2-amino-4-hydroxy-6-hydroxymethyldihydropteridine diphosphokinase [Bacteroidales bacterium]